MVQVKEIKEIGKWGVDNKWKITKPIEESINEFLESINDSVDRFIDIKYQETTALIIYSTLKPKKEKS